jgi:hypothetical protein
VLLLILKPDRERDRRVLTKMLNDGHYDEKSYLRSFLYGRDDHGHGQASNQKKHCNLTVNTSSDLKWVAIRKVSQSGAVSFVRNF